LTKVVSRTSVKLLFRAPMKHQQRPNNVQVGRLQVPSNPQRLIRRLRITLHRSILLDSGSAVQTRLVQLPAHLESDNGEEKSEEVDVVGGGSGDETGLEGRGVDEREEEDLGGEETGDEIVELKGERRVSQEFVGKMDRREKRTSFFCGRSETRLAIATAVGTL
jgi:hypothetical protein